MGHQTMRGGENKLFSSQMRQNRSPDGADGCCITSNKSLTCLQLVFTSNWSNFRHAFASRGFVSVRWAFFVWSTCHSKLDCMRGGCLFYLLLYTVGPLVLIAWNVKTRDYRAYI